MNFASSVESTHRTLAHVDAVWRCVDLCRVGFSRFLELTQAPRLQRETALRCVFGETSFRFDSVASVASRLHGSQDPRHTGHGRKEPTNDGVLLLASEHCVFAHWLEPVSSIAPYENDYLIPFPSCQFVGCKNTNSVTIPRST